MARLISYYPFPIPYFLKYLTLNNKEYEKIITTLGNGNDSHTSLGAATYAGGSNDACKENERHSAG